MGAQVYYCLFAGKCTRCVSNLLSSSLTFKAIFPKYGQQCERWAELMHDKLTVRTRCYSRRSMSIKTTKIKTQLCLNLNTLAMQQYSQHYHYMFVCQVKTGLNPNSVFVCMNWILKPSVCWLYVQSMATQLVTPC